MLAETVIRILRRDEEERLSFRDLQLHHLCQQTLKKFAEPNICTGLQEADGPPQLWRIQNLWSSFFFSVSAGSFPPKQTSENHLKGLETF